MLTILIGRANTGKSGVILQRIQQNACSGRAQILLAPEHASHQAEVDLCRVCGSTASRYSEVLSFRRLCDRVLSITGRLPQVSLDAGGKLLTLQKAIMESTPLLTVYQRPSRKAAFLQQLSNLLDEFRTYNVSPENLLTQAEQISGASRQKLIDLAIIYGACEARLHRPGLDARTPLAKLCDYLADSEYIKNKDIYIDGFTYFNAQEYKILEIFLRQAHSLTITLLGELNSKEEIFEMSLETLEKLKRLAYGLYIPVHIEVCQRLPQSEQWQLNPSGRLEYTGNALEYLEQYFFSDPPIRDLQTQTDKTKINHQIIFTGDTSAIRIRESLNAYEEVEQTAADIRRLLYAGKCRCRDITVVARNMTDYESMIETVFQRYDIPVYISRRSDILEKPAFSLVTGVLTAVANGYEYEDMFRWLKTGLAMLAPEECDILENYVLKWDIHGNSWIKDEVWTENPDGYGMRWTEERQARLDMINALRERVRMPLFRLAAGLKSGETAWQKIDALYTFLEELDLQNTLESRMKAQWDEGRLQEAEETRQIWDILCEVLDQFVGILGDEAMDLDEFTRLLKQVLTQYSIGTIPVSLDQVSVMEITRNERHAGAYLFFLGVTDDVLPAPGQSGGILNEDDREALSQRGIDLAPTGMAQMSLELQNLYAALAQPKRQLTISYPISNIAGTELRPAFVIDRIQKLFPDIWIQRESGYEYRMTAPVPALEMAGQHLDDMLWNCFEQKPEYQDRLTAMRHAAALSRGKLSPVSVKLLYGHQISMTASRAERLRNCHFAYFMEYGLRAKARSAAEFNAPQVGTLLHFLLENVTREVKEQGGFANLDNQILHELTEKYMRAYIQQELPNLQNRSARFQHLFARLKDLAFAVIDQIAEELRHSDFVPIAFELGIGSQENIPAVVIREAGTELHLSGRADRVDGWLKDEILYLRVIDYKSGHKAFDLADVRMGLNIQMLLYLFTIQDKGQSYFGRKIVPAGVLYAPTRNDLLSVERNITPEKLQKEYHKRLQRSGLLLSEPDVLQAMEHESLSEPRYLPLKIKKDGSMTGDLATAERFGRLARYIDQILHEIAAELQSGNIDADPCCHSEEDTACKYCQWVDACHFCDGRDGDHLRYILPVKRDEFFAMLEREEYEQEEYPENRQDIKNGDAQEEENSNG